LCVGMISTYTQRMFGWLVKY